MKKIIIISLILLGLITPIANAQNPKKKVAVYMTGEIENSYKKVIGAKLVTAITATDEYAAVERTADFLAALSSEQDYQTSGAVKDSQIARIGQQFGVRYVVVADVNELFDEIFIAARLINVETGLVEKAADASSIAENMSQLVDLSSQISNKLLIGAATGSKKAKHLSLCASKNGEIFYFTEEQWKKLDETEKGSIKKHGICLIKDGEVKILEGIGSTNLGSLKGLKSAANHSWTSFIINNSNIIDQLQISFWGERLYNITIYVMHSDYQTNYDFTPAHPDNNYRTYTKYYTTLFSGGTLSSGNSDAHVAWNDLLSRKVNHYILRDISDLAI